ncbi:hypothetical protein T11_1483 [Trichinella zimbabwensis]|uniref:Uncharacterized protein n=1 Tax=Trichinella zimbabwensis TaxID=268475 RepID=A0A0V1GMU1_9BILA|nr:hypothetical protein T11_1483 [Trichinella zimbabwensis]
MHYVFTQILRYSHAVLDCASLGAHVLHFQTYLDQLPSLPSIQESCDLSCRSQFGKIVIATFSFLIYVVGCRYERSHSLIVMDTLDKELEFSFIPFLSVISVT